MLLKLARRILTEPDARLLLRFGWTVGWKGMRAIDRFTKRAADDDVFPPFLFISITNNCNLSCQGCWVTPTSPPRELALPVLDNIIAACKREGSYFFGLLGGEPLLHRGLFELIARHRDCYFQLFSNGTLITEAVAKEMRRLGNVSPLISIEGLEHVSDERRGGQDVFRRAMDGLEQCRRQRLITGVASSVCRSNIDEVATPEFVDDLVRRGVHYLWYYIYRPAGPRPCPELTLSAADILRLRQFIVDIRTRAPIMVIDAYWDHLGRAICPAATGISHHISPAGDVEPCPPIQFARDRIGDGQNLAQVLRSSQFLHHFRDLARAETRGCILLEKPGVLFDFLAAEKARDTSGRDTAFAELAAMSPQPGHHLPGQEIPEASWLYRFAKKKWFFGFGAYG